MRKLFCILMLLLFTAAMVNAASLVTDPNPQMAALLASGKLAQFEIWSGTKGLTEVQIPVQGKSVIAKNVETDGSIKYVIDSLAPGSFNWYVRHVGDVSYTYTDASGKPVTVAGGTVYSTFVPFDFSKSSTLPNLPTGIKLSN